MATLGKTGLEVSRIGLGTVEIGIADYAVGQKGLVEERDATRLLQEAVELGVTYVDTARAYGVAEERIGKSGIGKQQGVVIGTKCAQFLEKGEDPRGPELEKRIRDDVEESLRALQTDSIQLLQLHGGSKEQIERGELIEILQKLKDEEKIQHAGIATRGEEATIAAIESGFFETVQMAYSILDQRLAAPLSLRRRGVGGEVGVGIINRSVFLKGVLTPSYAALPDSLSKLKEHASAAQAIAENIGTDLPSLALRFVLSHDAISTALIGTANARHIQSALTAARAEKLQEDILEQLRELAIEDPNLIDPAKWPRQTQTV